MESVLKVCTRIVTVLLLYVSCTVSVFGESTLVVTKTRSEVKNDPRFSWNNQLLKLALEVSREEYGDYKIELAPLMSEKRIWESIRSQRFPNLLMSSPLDSKRTAMGVYDYVPFPTEMGLLGYRVCFIPSSEKERIGELIADGRYAELVHGQHQDWEDVAILRANGYRVTTVDDYLSLFKMTAAGRFDLFCRGVTEIQGEWEKYRSLGGFEVQPDLAFFYEFPSFFTTHKDNREVLERVEFGLKKAYASGALQKMFYRYKGKAIDFAKLHQRTIILMRNPALHGIDRNYLRYDFLAPTLMQPR